MPSQLTLAHMEAERRLREATVRAIKSIWADLPGYNREDIPDWLLRSVPIIRAAQEQSAQLTVAYIARALEEQPTDVSIEDILRSTRSGVSLDEVYQRPFVTVWTDLGNGIAWQDAQAAGLARAAASAAMDVQLAMRSTANAVERANPGVYGYRRVANAKACAFCQQVNGAYVKGSQYVLALHPGCGCGLELLTEPHRGAVKLPDGTEIRPYAYGPLNDKVAVYDHGELGPILGAPNQNFTSEADLAHSGIN